MSVFLIFAYNCIYKVGYLHVCDICCGICIIVFGMFSHPNYTTTNREIGYQQTYLRVEVTMQGSTQILVNQLD